MKLELRLRLRLAMTTPSKAWTRLRVPSTTLTLTITVSPGAKGGIVRLRLAISSRSRVWIMSTEGSCDRARAPGRRLAGRRAALLVARSKAPARQRIEKPQIVALPAAAGPGTPRPRPRAAPRCARRQGDRGADP